MGFIKNVLEDKETFLIELMNSKKFREFNEREAKLREIEESIRYRTNDVIYLAQEGFVYESILNRFTKEEDIDYGKFPGKYRISLSFPEDYPKSPPKIIFKPLFIGKSGKDWSEHIGTNGNICIANVHHGMPNTYWKSHMNARGALRLAYNLATNELEKRVNKGRKKIPIGGTIFFKIKQIVPKGEFIEEFIAKKESKDLVDIDNSWEWEEIAFKISQLSQKVKIELVDYYNEKKTSIKSKNKQKNKGDE